MRAQVDGWWLTEVNHTGHYKSEDEDGKFSKEEEEESRSSAQSIRQRSFLGVGVVQTVVEETHKSVKCLSKVSSKEISGLCQPHRLTMRMRIRWMKKGRIGKALILLSSYLSIYYYVLTVFILVSRQFRINTDSAFRLRAHALIG